jgi:hypothetical protein
MSSFWTFASNHLYADYLQNGMRENEPFWLDSPEKEGLVPIMARWQLIPPSFMHVFFVEV